jgi:hypothetical protein
MECCVVVASTLACSVAMLKQAPAARTANGDRRRRQCRRRDRYGDRPIGRSGGDCFSDPPPPSNNLRSEFLGTACGCLPAGRDARCGRAAAFGPARKRRPQGPGVLLCCVPLPPRSIPDWDSPLPVVGSSVAAARTAFIRVGGTRLQETHDGSRSGRILASVLRQASFCFPLLARGERSAGVAGGQRRHRKRTCSFVS